MENEQKDKYVFIGTQFFFNGKSTAHAYLKLNNPIGDVEVKYLFETAHEEFLENNIIFRLDHEVFNRIVVTKVFDSNGEPSIISKLVPDNICRDLIYTYNQLANEYSFDDNFIKTYINDDYKLRIRERGI